MTIFKHRFSDGKEFVMQSVLCGNKVHIYYPDWKQTDCGLNPINNDLKAVDEHITCAKCKGSKRNVGWIDAETDRINAKKK